MLRDKRLNASSAVLYGILCSYAQDSFDGTCYATRDKLAEHLGRSVATVKRAAARLIECGYVERREVGKLIVYRPLILYRPPVETPSYS